MTRRRVIVSGDVQGVYFRDTCRITATRYGVTGWVRNLPDGAVEAVFEGESDDVARLEAWAHRGPSRAIVGHVYVFEEDPEGLVGFEIRPTPTPW
ncbi:acylphosphatase [Embleya sp. NBC_00896]|uniref:acylphosphatase n=1 Tax=Embleya sp. NBC_00896 TaxID=2975961 RepID=UPI002F906C87|nr:acylphosphatase [Embleya sp. NBC_00896]